MIICVIAVQMMQAAIVDVIHVRSVLHHVVLLASMAVAMIIARHEHNEFLGGGIGRSDIEHMFINMAIMHMMQMPVVKIIDMPCMF